MHQARRRALYLYIYLTFGISTYERLCKQTAFGILEYNADYIVNYKLKLFKGIYRYIDLTRAYTVLSIYAYIFMLGLAESLKLSQDMQFMCTR